MFGCLEIEVVVFCPIFLLQVDLNSIHLNKLQYFECSPFSNYDIRVISFPVDVVNH